MKTYCVKCNTTHDDSIPCFDATAQAAKDMGVKFKDQPSSPAQARSDNAALSKATILVVLSALALILIGAFLFSS